MKKLRIESTSQLVDREWLGFPGGELEGPRPSVLCAACRDKLRATANRSGASKAANAPNPSNQPVCFACYRATLERERALKAAGELSTASEARFQTLLPFEPVNQPRLTRLRAERAVARATSKAGAGQYVDKRRQAQMAARHALERIVIGLRERNAPAAERDRALESAAHAAELQLPAAWLPFVMAR